MSLKKDIGKNIKSIRKKQKMTQKELADKLNMNVQNISQIERGIYLPSTLAMFDISQSLSVTPNELFLGEAVYKTQEEGYRKVSLEEIEHLIANHTKEMQDLLHRKTDYNPSVQVQEKYERKELLKMISEKAKTNDDLRELIEYQFNKQLNELIEKFKHPPDKDNKEAPH